MRTMRSAIWAISSLWVIITVVCAYFWLVTLISPSTSWLVLLAFVFAVIFVWMGVYFLRYYELQRRLDLMTEEERAAFFENGGAILMPKEMERLNAEKEEKEGFTRKPKS